MALNYFITCSLVHVTVDTNLILLVFSMLYSYGSDNMESFCKEVLIALVCCESLLTSYKLGEGNCLHTLRDNKGGYIFTENNDILSEMTVPIATTK